MRPRMMQFLLCAALLAASTLPVVQEGIALAIGSRVNFLQPLFSQ